MLLQSFDGIVRKKGWFLLSQDDAITQLSDQLVALSIMLQDIERRQGLGLAADIAA
jgi:hypothetical protein